MNILWYLIVSGGFMTIGLLGSKAQEIKRLKGELARREAAITHHCKTKMASLK